MPTALRPPTIALMLISTLALSLLAGCGSSGVKACNATGCCGAGDLCVAPQYLYAAGIDGQVRSFPVDRGTGLLGSPATIAGPAPTFGLAAMNNQFLYASVPFIMSTGAIDAWSINLGTGALTTVPGSPFALGPFSASNGLAASPTGVLYVADAGTIDALQADATGALTPIAGSPFSAGANVFLALDPQNRFLFASDGTPPGNVLAYTIDSAGALNSAPGSPFPTIPNFVGNTQPFQIVVDSTGSYVYVVLNATNQVAAFSITPATGALTPVPGSPFSTGSAPLILTTVSHFLYVANAMDHNVSGYSIDPATGILTPLANSPFAISAGSLTTNPFGGFLYASGSSGMQVFSIDANTGALTAVGTPAPFPGATVLTFVP